MVALTSLERRSWLGAMTLAVLAAPALSQSITVERLTAVPGRPTKIAAAPGMAHQFFVTEKSGRIWIVRGTAVPGVPALDIRARVNQNGENGLMGLAFHPDFQANRLLYLFYTQNTGAGDSVISEFRMTPGSDDSIDPTSERVLVGPIPQITEGHKSGDLEFGPDGYLYASLGDGDAGSALGLGTAQDLSSPLGKILRIDVDAPPPHVPATNPFAQVAGAEPLIWAYGLRNPWRFGIDQATGAVFIGDVGTTIYEEIDMLTVAQAGANFGWPCLEGPQCTGNAACACQNASLVPPLLPLQRSSGSTICAVMGGLVPHGSGIPRLDGNYVFGDFCSSAIFMLEDPYGAAHLVDLTPELDPSHQQALRFMSDLAQGPHGEILIALHYNGDIWRIRPRGGFQPYCVAAVNSTGMAAALTASGSPSVAAADLRPSVSHLPVGVQGYFIAAQVRAYVPQILGYQGNLCVGLPVSRWASHVLTSDAQGHASLTSDLTDLPWGTPPAPGETWNFQYWLRDANPTPTANFSNAVAVTFEP